MIAEQRNYYRDIPSVIRAEAECRRLELTGEIYRTTRRVYYLSRCGKGLCWDNKLHRYIQKDLRRGLPVEVENVPE